MLKCDREKLFRRKNKREKLFCSTKVIFNLKVYAENFYETIPKLRTNFLRNKAHRFENFYRADIATRLFPQRSQITKTNNTEATKKRAYLCSFMFLKT